MKERAGYHTLRMKNAVYDTLHYEEMPCMNLRKNV